MKRMLSVLMVAALLLSMLLPVATAQAEELKYWIGVDIANQRTTIYSTADNSVVHRWICSTGKKGYTTPVGVYYLPEAKGQERQEWFAFTGSYVKYCVCYKKGLYFHSILFRRKSDDSVMQSSIDRLGQIASHGCIRLEVQHARWLCDNCPTGTKVVIHNGTSDPRIVEALGGDAGIDLTTPLPAPKYVQSLYLDRSGTVALNKGEALKLNCTVFPEEAETKLSWKSSAAKYAAVGADGTVTGMAEGTATITVTSQNGKKASVKIKVVDPYKPTGVKLDQAGTVTLNRGEALRLSASLTPETAQSDLKWATSNKRYATVGADGTVTGVAEGTATITVKTYNGKRASVKVKVVDPYKPTGVKLDQTGTVTLNRGETLQLSASLTPETAQSELKWTTSNKKYATVGADGMVTGVAEGTATVTVKTYNGKRASVKVKVVDPYKPTGVKLDQAGTVTIEQGETLKLSASLSPETAQSELKWTTSNKKYATVGADGTVTGVAKGTATITVKTYNGKKTSVKIRVVPATPKPTEAPAASAELQGVEEESIQPVPEQPGENGAQPEATTPDAEAPVDVQADQPEGPVQNEASV